MNESAQPMGRTGFVLLTLSLLSSAKNLTYSNTLNASSLPEIFPYLIALNNQSFSYQTQNIAFSVHILNTGSVPVTFNGKSYEATDYKISASVTNSTSSSPVLASGYVVTMPSGLIYSIELQVSSLETVRAQLLATSLSLVNPAGSTFPLGLALVSAGLLGSVAFAVPTVFKRLKGKREAQPTEQNEPKTEGKPSYWVD